MTPSSGAPQAPARPHLIHAHFHLLVTMVLFGTAFTGSKAVVGQMPHQTAAAFRFGGGALVLLVVLAVTRRASRERPAFSWREAVRAGLVGLVGVFGYNVFFFWGLALAPSVDGTILVPVLSPVLTTAVLLVTRQERASAARVAGLGLGLAGAAIFLLGADDGTGLDGSRLTGDLVFLAGSACWAVYSIASKKLLGGMDHVRATAYGTCAGAVALILLAVPSMASLRWSDVPTGTWLTLACLAVGPTAVAYVFYYRVPGQCRSVDGHDADVHGARVRSGLVRPRPGRVLHSPPGHRHGRPAGRGGGRCDGRTRAVGAPPVRHRSGPGGRPLTARRAGREGAPPARDVRQDDRAPTGTRSSAGTPSRSRAPWIARSKGSVDCSARASA